MKTRTQKIIATSLIILSVLLLSFNVSKAAFDGSLWNSRGTYIEPIFSNGINILIKGSNKYLNFGTLSGSSGYGVRDNSGTIEIKNSGGAWAAPSAGGEANTASNLGTGEGIFGTKVGVDLRFKSLIAGTGVTFSTTTNDITINSSATGGGATTTINNATGPAFTFATSSDTNLGLNITSGASTVTFTPTWIGTLANSRIASSSVWNAAAASTTALTPTYIRSQISENIAGMVYSTTTGLFSQDFLYGGLPAISDINYWDGKADYAFTSNNFSGTGNFTTSGAVRATSSHTTNATTTNLAVTGWFKMFTQVFTDLPSFVTYIQTLITENITGLAFSGGQLSLEAGYKLLTDNASSTWDTAYTDRLKWDGGATGLVASTGRTSLGLTDTATLASTTFALASHTQATSTITGVFGVPSGGTGATTLTGILLGNGTSPVTTITNSSANWDAAAASTTAMNPGYLRGLFSNTATGLSYSSATGVTTFTAGYSIPITASSTERHNFFATPSTRITAGTGLSWTGNMLNSNGASSTIANTWPLLQTFTTGISIPGYLRDGSSATGTSGLCLLSTGTSTAWTTCPGAGGGEANTASNLGTGYGLFTSKVGVDLQFKSLIAGTGITMSTSTTGLTINSTASGGSNWTLGAGFLRPATSTDGVSVGTTTSFATFSLAGSYAQRILSNSTTTFTIYNASSTAVFNLDTTATTTQFVVGGGDSGGILGGSGLIGQLVGNIDTGASTVVDFALRRAENTTASLGTKVYWGRQRGTIASPTTVISGDMLYELFGYGYDGTDYAQSTAIKSTVEGVVSNNVLSGVLSFFTANPVGDLIERLKINSKGWLVASLPQANGTATKKTTLNDPWGIPSITTANYQATYSDDMSRMLVWGTATSSTIYLRNGGFAAANQLYIGTTAQSIQHVNLGWGGAPTAATYSLVGRGAITYQGYHYVLRASTTNANYVYVHRATSTDTNSIATGGQWATTTISGIALPTTAFLIGAYNNTLYFGTTTTAIQPYTISTTTNTLTSSSTGVVITGANLLLTNTRVNDQYIHAGFGAAPFIRKYTHTGAAVANITNSNVAVPSTTGPDIFVTPSSIYALAGNSTTYLTKLLGF
jgi:hypothetical protein